MPFNYDGRNVDNIDKKPRVKNPRSFGKVYALYYGDGIHMTRRGFVEFDMDEVTYYLNSSDNIYDVLGVKVGYASMVDGSPKFFIGD